jgi:hypothetical protein
MYRVNKYLFYLTGYFVLMHVIPFLNMFLNDKKIKTFLVIDCIAIYSILLTLYYVFNYIKRLTLVDAFVLLYLTISIFSFFLYLQKDNPASVFAYAYGIHFLVFPMFLFFSVKLLEASRQNSLLKSIYYLNLFFLIVGLILFYSQPEFYTNYLRDYYAASGDLDLWQLYGRMGSYFGTTAVGNIAPVTMLLGLITGAKGFKMVFIASIAIISALLSQQRSAMVMIFIATIYYIFSRNESVYRKAVSLLLCFFIITGLFLAYNQQQEGLKPISLIEYTLDRISNEIISGNPYKERRDSYQKGWNFFEEYPFGLGIGATTSRADDTGLHPGGQVVDANYMRILADLGIVGLLVFAIIIILSLRSAIKNEKPLPWMLILLIYTIQASGTNIFDSYYVVHTFWLLLGVIDSRSGNATRFQYINKTIINKGALSAHI